MSNNSKKLSESDVSANPLRYGSIPWPKWSDYKLNKEQWNSSGENSTSFYTDPQPIVLPSSLKPHSWLRPHQIKNLQPIIHSSISSNNLTQLFTNNQHLIASEFMRWFISSIIILSYYGRDGLEVNENSDFSWNYGDKPWHGSLHIYSMNKAGPGTLHDPKINPYGRYIARLFFMGHWRCIEIDDLIPVDSDKKLLLPCVENVHELWCILLAKAMLKIAALSWISDSEINDFNPIVCLTGWTCMSLDITYMSLNDRWKSLSKYCETYNLSNVSDNQLNRKKVEEKTIKNQKKENGKRKNNEVREQKVREKNYFPIVTLLCIPDKSNNLEKISDGIIPNYPAYVESISDITSNPSLIKPPLESWKLHRWIPWAIRQGIIDPADYFIPTRRIFLLNPTNVALINEEKKLSPIWLDFNKLAGYPMNIYFFFKLKYFKCSIDVADVMPDKLYDDTKEKLNSVTQMNKKKLEDREFDDMTRMKKNYRYNHIGIQSKNEPLYLFIDSIHSKFLLFDFSVHSEPGRNSSLITERHCWFNRPLENKPLLEIITKGTKSKTLCLEPGRHLLRIFCQSKNSYYLTISSDTNFHVGDRRQMHELMQSESDRMKILAKKIINSMTDVFNSFGSSNYRDMLKNYYRSYMPEINENSEEVSLYKLIHNYFREELITLIVKKSREDVFESLRIFFHDPTIRKNFDQFFYDKPMKYTPNPSMKDITEQFGEDNQNYYHNKIIVNAVVIIQSFWRMVRINLYKKIHNVNHPRHNLVQKTLHQILLNVIDLNSVCDLVRNFIKRDKKLLNLYPCTGDYEKILETKKIKGNITSPFFYQWIPIVRFTLNTPNNSIVFACLDLFIDLPAYILHVFNNDTGHELQRIVNNNIPFHYKRKTKGYTVIGYGWSHEKWIKDLQWCLHLTTIKGEPQLIFFKDDKPILSPAEILPNKIYELSNIYIPNIDNIIFKAILKMPGGGCASFRVHTTYEKVQMKLKIRNNDGEIISEVCGGSTIILPIVHLNNDKNKWIIEAIISPNCWPLTADEWNNVINIKQSSNYQSKVRKQSVSIGKNRNNRQTSSTYFEVPRWFLQVVIDADGNLELYHDISKYTEIQQIKASWKLNNPDRIDHGKRLRQNFFRQNNIEKLLNDSGQHIKNIRTLQPPQKRIIPPLDLSKFIIDRKNEKRRLKTKLDEELERIEHEQNLIRFEESYTSFIEYSCSLLCELQMNVALSLQIPTKRNL